MSESKDELFQEIMNNVAAIRRLMATCMQRADSDGMTPSQAESLLIIAHEGPLTPKELAALMQLTPGAITQLVEQLERLDYVTRTPSKTDRRVTHLEISAKGHEQISVLKRKKIDMFKNVYKDLSAEELRILNTVQKKMITYLKSQSNA